MSRSREILVAIGLGAVAALTYIGSLGVGFYSDDYKFLGLMNPMLERPSFAFHIFYRDFIPLQHFSYLLDWLLWPRNSIASHAHSLLVHGGCAGLLFLLLRRLGAAPLLAATATLTWALNVRLSEPAIWVASRGHSLSALLVLATVLGLGSDLRAWRAAGVVFWLAALLTKETALLPMAAIPWLWPRLRRNRALLAALAAIAVSFLACNFFLKPSFHLPVEGPADRVLKLPFLLLRPLGLGDRYGFHPAPAALVLGGFALAALALRRTLVLPGLLWVASSLAPVVVLAKLTSRYLYLPSIGYAIALCGLVQWAGGKTAGRARRAAAGLALSSAALLLVANVLDAQREVEDYRRMTVPYDSLLESFRRPLSAVAPGETIVVLDLGPRDALARLARALEDRPTIRKLVPNPSAGIAGMLELVSVSNILLRQPGMLAYPIRGDASGPRRTFLTDGTTVREVPASLAARVAPERLFAVRWGEAAAYFAEPEPEGR